jgi:hypothetical protein
MGYVTIFGIFLVLIASLAISTYSARKRPSDLLQDFLFSGNTALLALSSCIGSIVSMAVSFTALLSAGYVWGWQIIFPMIVGSLVGLAAILKLSKSPKVVASEDRIKRGAFVYGASYLAVLGSRSSLAYYVFLIVGYCAMLVTEIVVLRAFIGYFTDLMAAELLLTIATILVVCYAYVYIGGFRGVLVTDYFQLIVVFVFVGLWIVEVAHSPNVHLPSPFTSKTAFTGPARAYMYLGVFAGAFAWTFASIDQWYRTLGTLPAQMARRVLTSSAIALCIFSIVPVLAGAAALTRRDISAPITNGISLVLVTDLLKNSSTTLRLLFAMALTCAALTTLNTYFMTLQQLYYEASTRIDSSGWIHYLLVKYPLKWKSVRGFVAVLGAVAFSAACFFPDRYVYAFGVLSLSCLILMIPFLGAALGEEPVTAPNSPGRRLLALLSARLMARSASAVTLGTTVWIILLAVSRVSLGSLTSHLFMIPATALVAAIAGALTTLAVPTRPRVHRSTPRC